MKLYTLCLGLWSLLLVPMMSNAQVNASMNGNWYNPDTAELLVIDTDRDGSVKGRGVYYAQGSSTFKMMQIMTQTTKQDPELGEIYYMRVYDPSNPALELEIKSQMTPGGIILYIKRKGRNDTQYWQDLSNSRINKGINTARLPQTRAHDYLRELLCKLTFYQQDSPEVELHFVCTEGPPFVGYGINSGNFTIAPTNHRITFNLQPFGNCRAVLSYQLYWQLDLISNTNGNTVATLYQNTSH